MSARPVIVWFRRDLRLRDQPAWHHACASGAPVVPVYVHDEGGEGGWAPGAASRWWLHHSLAALGRELAERGSRLILARGPAADVLERLVGGLNGAAVYWNRRYEPAVIARDAAIKQRLAAAGVEARSFNASLLHEPHEVLNKQGNPFQVFTPFWRTCLDRPVPPPLDAPPPRAAAPARGADSLALDALELRPRLAWADGFSRHWTPGEAGAAAMLQRFLAGPVEAYDARRDQPAEAGTSRLSPHLHFGEIGPRQIWSAVKALGAEQGIFPPHNGARVFLSELGWREFGYHLLYHFPATPEAPLRAEFARFPWREDPGDRLLTAWRKGRTGYPLVDAAQRELWATGWMHNRARMVVASFLVKHLRLPWQAGAAWFWDTLVDANLANNTLGWQWSAGCGADAAPYFRIFNPVLQGLKFDPDGAYVRRWLPELSRLPAAVLHAPWTAPEAVRAQAGVRLGETYPHPVVDHATARSEALTALGKLKEVAP